MLPCPRDREGKVKTDLISYPFKTFTEILGNILEGFGMKTVNAEGGDGFLLGNSEDVAPFSPPGKYLVTHALNEVPARSAGTKSLLERDSILGCLDF